MKINFTQTAVAAAVLGAFTFGSAQAASIKIDDFTTPQTVESAGAGDNDVSGPIANPGSDFATRTMETLVLTTVQPTLGIGSTAAAGSLSINKDADTTAKAWITWNNATGLDFTNGGIDDSVEYQIIQNNVLVQLTFDVMDAGGTTGYFRAADIGGLVSNENRNFEFAAVSWNSAEDQSGSDVSAAIDWTSIAQFSVHIDSAFHDFGTDTIIGLVQTADLVTPPTRPTPEPAGILLMGLGIAGLGAMRRKRA